MAGVIAANIFHPFKISGASVIWAAELNELEKMLSAAVHPRGVAERVLLDWFGMKAERVAMLVFALHGVIPTHVAREFDIGNFRSDFAWISNIGLGEHQVGLVELEDALPETLFTSNGRKTRNTPYIGMRFLSGFSQLVDWCSFGQAEVARHPLISNVIGAYRGPCFIILRWSRVSITFRRVRLLKTGCSGGTRILNLAMAPASRLFQRCARSCA